MAEGPRGTLRARLAIWMIASTAFTLIAFAGALYISLSYEERDDQPTANSEALGVDASEQVLLSMLVAGPLALVVAVGGALVLSKRALAPLHDVIAGARSITASGLHRRLALPTRRDELHALVRHLNELFGRLEQGFGALSRYATEASHELRTPLAVIASELEIALLRPRTNEEWERTARASLHEIRGMARLVDSLLALSRAEGPLARSVVFDLREQVDQVLASVDGQARAHGLALTAAAEGGDAPNLVEGDPDAVTSAVRNLVDNALRYTPAGGQIRVGVRRESAVVVVQVDDSGPGVAYEEREAIFSPLTRGQKRVNDRHPDGHGLGLAISRRIVERHGGTITAGQSDSGGASFVIHLPAARSAEVRPGQP